MQVPQSYLMFPNRFLLSTNCSHRASKRQGDARGATTTCGVPYVVEHGCMRLHPCSIGTSGITPVFTFVFLLQENLVPHPWLIAASP